MFSIDWFPLWLSLRVAALSTALGIAIGVWIAYVLANRSFKHRFGKVLRPWQEALKSYITGNDKVQSQNDK